MEPTKRPLQKLEQTQRFQNIFGEVQGMFWFKKGLTFSEAALLWLNAPEVKTVAELRKRLACVTEAMKKGA